MKILVVTPCFNSESLIRKTLDAVLSQAVDGISVTYVVRDGGSTDSTVRILEEYRSRFLKASVKYSFVSERDTGMYDALAKGFLDHSGERFDWYAYINAGDFFAPRSFANLNSSTRVDDHWVTGINMIYNEVGDIIGARVPGPYYRGLITRGFFGTILPCIQQESTFWRHEAHALIDFSKLRKLRLAGDYYLWNCFASKYDLKVLSVWLSGFSVHGGQLSEVRRDEYYRELRSLAASRFRFLYIPAAVLVGILWSVPNSLKLRWFPDLVRPFQSKS